MHAAEVGAMLVVDAEGRRELGVYGGEEAGLDTGVGRDGVAALLLATLPRRPPNLPHRKMNRCW
jgi:hypothetical protein